MWRIAHPILKGWVSNETTWMCTSKLKVGRSIILNTTHISFLYNIIDEGPQWNFTVSVDNPKCHCYVPRQPAKLSLPQPRTSTRFKAPWRRGIQGYHLTGVPTRGKLPHLSAASGRGTVHYMYIHNRKWLQPPISLVTDFSHCHCRLPLCWSFSFVTISLSM